MSQRNATPWERVSDYILDCGQVHEPYHFYVNALKSIDQLVDFDEAMFLMLDGNRHIVRKYFLSNLYKNMSVLRGRCGYGMAASGPAVVKGFVVKDAMVLRGEDARRALLAGVDAEAEEGLRLEFLCGPERPYLKD